MRSFGDFNLVVVKEDGQTINSLLFIYIIVVHACPSNLWLLGNYDIHYELCEDYGTLGYGI